MKYVDVKNITVRGELRARLIKNFSRLHDKIYRSGIAGLPPYCCIGWPGDWEGRAMLALVLDSEALKTDAADLENLVDWIYSLMNDEGYRSEPGDKLNLCDINEQMHSAQNWLMRAFMEYYRVTGRAEYLETVKTILEKLYLPIKPHLKNYPRTAEDRSYAHEFAVVGKTNGQFREWRLSSDTGCLFMCMDGLSQAWEMIEEEPLKSEIWDLICEMLETFRNLDYVGGMLQTHATMTGMRGIMRIYKKTGDPTLLETLKKYFADYEKYGLSASFANRVNFKATNCHTEPCGIVDSYMLACQLWEETGDRHYLDLSNKIWWNGLMRAQRENGGMGCETTVDDGRLKVFDVFYEAAHCCTMRGAEGLGYPVRHAAYGDSGALAVPFWFDFDARIGLGTMKVRTKLPEAGYCSVEFEGDIRGVRELSLYIPEWAEPEIIVNGEKTVSGTDGCFAVVKKNFTSGDRVEIRYEIPLYILPADFYGHTGRGRCLVMYGDLVLGTESALEEKIETVKFKYDGNTEFTAYGRKFVPLHRCRDMSKEEVMVKSWQIVFNG